MLTTTRKFFKDLWAVTSKNVISDSAKGAISRTDWLKVVRNALFVGTSSSLLFLIENLAENFLSSIGQGLAIAVLNGAVELCFRKIRDNKETIDGTEISKPKE